MPPKFSMPRDFSGYSHTPKVAPPNEKRRVLFEKPFQFELRPDGQVWYRAAIETLEVFCWPKKKPFLAWHGRNIEALLGKAPEIKATIKRDEWIEEWEEKSHHEAQQVCLEEAVHQFGRLLAAYNRPDELITQPSPTTPSSEGQNSNT